MSRHFGVQSQVWGECGGPLLVIPEIVGNANVSESASEGHQSIIPLLNNQNGNQRTIKQGINTGRSQGIRLEAFTGITSQSHWLLNGRPAMPLLAQTTRLAPSWCQTSWVSSCLTSALPHSLQIQHHQWPSEELVWDSVFRGFSNWYFTYVQMVWPVYSAGSKLKLTTDLFASFFLQSPQNMHDIVLGSLRNTLLTTLHLCSEPFIKASKISSVLPWIMENQYPVMIINSAHYIWNLLACLTR